MELKEFIEKSICDITTALHKSSDKMINEGSGRGISDSREIKVSFDIAVTVDDSKEKGGNAKISVLDYFGFEAGNKSGTKIQEVSRISFEVPVKLKTINESNYHVG